MKLLQLIWCFIILLFGIKCSNNPPVEEIKFLPVDITYKMSKEELYIADQINSIRLNNGLNSLINDKTHYEIAEVRNLRNFKQDTISHNGFVEDMMPLTTKKMVPGENLAFKYTVAESAVKAWENSEDHLKNILNPKWQYTGIKVSTKTETGDKYYTQVFSRHQ